jgi:hypothetical protein
MGFSRYQIDFRQVSSGRGSGEQWVRQQYPNAVRDYRTRSAKAETALIAIVDADVGEVGRRNRQFQTALEQTGSPARSKDEAIIHMIPRRSIETWVLSLNGEQVNEETDYSVRDVDHLIAAAAAKFHEWIAQPPKERLPSVGAAIEEAKKLQ